MRKIITVTGEISPEELGFCQFHEHLLIRKGKSYEVNPALYMDDVEKSKEEMIRYRVAGGGAVIDAQPGGCGRMAEGLECISRKSGVHVICSSGFHKLCYYPENHWIRTASEQEMIRFFKRELMEGIVRDSDETMDGPRGSQCAGIVKCAIDIENLTPRYKRLFSAAASAALECGRTMMVHIEKGADPLTLLDFLISCGMNPRHIVFCHMDRAIPDLEVHKKILSSGVYLEFDTIGRYKYHSDAAEIQIIKEMIRSGYEDQLLFSLDTTRLRLKTYTPGGVGLDYILRTFIPEMEEMDVNKRQIWKMSHDNPVKALSED